MKKILRRIILKSITILDFVNKRLADNIDAREEPAAVTLDPGEEEARQTAKLLGGNVKVGRWTYAGGGSSVRSFNSNEKVIIGKYCSIADDVQIFAGGEHGHKERVSTYPFKYKMLNIFPNPDPITKGVVAIGNDVWVGSHAIILSGVVINDGAVIGAGAVVTKDVPPYAIVAGNPGRVVGHRFSEDTIRKLLSIKWWDWDDDKIKKACVEFYGPIDKFVAKYSHEQTADMAKL